MLSSTILGAISTALLFNPLVAAGAYLGSPSSQVSAHGIEASSSIDHSLFKRTESTKVSRKPASRADAASIEKFMTAANKTLAADKEKFVWNWFVVADEQLINEAVQYMPYFSTQKQPDLDESGKRRFIQNLVREFLEKEVAGSFDWLLRTYLAPFPNHRYKNIKYIMDWKSENRDEDTTKISDPISKY